jgi:4'-phosphopantetheinyl transferase
VKAIGTGFTDGLAYFEVSVRPNAPAQLLAVHGNRPATGQWTMQSLPVPPGYHATLVVEGCDWEPSTFQLESGSRTR